MLVQTFSEGEGEAACEVDSLISVLNIYCTKIYHVAEVMQYIYNLFAYSARIEKS